MLAKIPSQRKCIFSDACVLPLEHISLYINGSDNKHVFFHKVEHEVFCLGFAHTITLIIK